MHRRVIYGEFSKDEWKPLYSLESAKPVIERMKAEIDWTGYELWVEGSILSDVLTHDIDLVVIGPLNVERINQILNKQVQIGFEEGIYVDTKWSASNEVYDPTVYNTKTIRYAYYRPSIRVNGRTSHFATEYNGLYLKDVTHPRKKRNIEYKLPMKLI